MTYNKLKEQDLWLLGRENNYESQNKELPAGMYTVHDYSNLFEGFKPGFELLRPKDSLIQFKSGMVATVIDKLDNFFAAQTIEDYKYLKVAHKMGLILHGPPGTGKTCTSVLIMLRMVEKYNAISLDCTGLKIDFIKNVIAKIREQQDTPIVIFYDEFEIIANQQDLLSFLDGNDSQSKVIFMGCTNFLDQIPKRIRKRKSRIKHLFNIDSLPITVYEEYVKEKLPAHSNKIRAELAFRAEEACLTIDQFKHAIIDYYIEKTSIEEAIKAAGSYKDQN